MEVPLRKDPPLHASSRVPDRDQLACYVKIQSKA